LERSDNPGIEQKRKANNGLLWVPKVVTAFQPWAEISERLRRLI